MGFVLMGIGVLLCFANSGGFVKFMKLRSLERHGVEGEAVSDLQEWISSGHRVYYHIRIPGAPPQDEPPHFIEVGPEPRGPVGTVVPVVYDRRKPKRAKTGSLAEIDSSQERGMVVFFWAPGLALIAVGAVLAIFFY
ncbi:hypothetical protein JHN63_24060 [Streptomyces sp. MBT65]|uniref:DUF3592 domain-containing protein n=1 Tax=Streptomyces sp. MBT65 TaxID=1488395 RepID=UPI00190D1793|nr:DUF3592 domain-containing protein [Streptomyces sp. MBT65]MBK3576825.1 hypothetical protein [Streptomyces sp. MBT65]